MKLRQEYQLLFIAFISIFQALYRNHPAGIHSHTALYIPDRVSVETKSLLNEVRIVQF